MPSARDGRFLALVAIVIFVAFILGRLFFVRYNSLEATGSYSYSDLSPRPMPDWEKKVKNNSKWIVVTTIQLPTKPMVTLSKLKGWSVVVVGDLKTPSEWSLPNCVFLSVERQKQLNYRIHRLLPYRAYSRKNIGYLFAIRHGAKVIYETDDDNELIVPTIESAFQVDLQSLNKNMLVYVPGEGEHCCVQQSGACTLV